CRCDALQALLPQRLGERAMDKPHPLLELGLFVLLGRFEGALEVVEDGQQLLHERLRRPGRERLLVARGPLAVVVELGLQALERVEVLVALALERLDPLVRLPELVLLWRLLRHSTLSASSMTSSASSVPEAPFPAVPPC